MVCKVSQSVILCRCVYGVIGGRWGLADVIGNLENDTKLRDPVNFILRFSEVY